MRNRFGYERGILPPVFRSILMSDSLHALRRRDPGDSQSLGSNPPKNKFKLPSLAKALPWLLVAAFLLLTWLLFGDRFHTGRAVELEKVVTTRAQEISAPSDTNSPGEVSSKTLSFDGPTLFQASGWIEPDPLLIRATTLYSGVVEAVHVLEGDRVQEGQLLATMVDDDAALDLQTAQAQLTQSNAALLSSQAMVAANEALLESTRREVAAAEARLNELTDESDRLTKAGRDVFRESQIKQAGLRVESQRAIVEATRAKVKEAEAQLTGSQAAIALAKGKLELTKVEVDRRQLALDRTQVRSPIDGRIQELYASPGMKRMLNMDGPETATIAKIYQPELLQARIDVPLEEAAQLVIGQPVRLRSTLLPDQVFEGQVTRIDGQADLQRNTLQAKVKILNPADKLRPEMLCRAEFLSFANLAEKVTAVASTSSGRVALYIPETALLGSGKDVSAWALDASGKQIELRELRIGGDRRDGHVHVIEGLRPGDFVVNNPSTDLEAGERVNAKSTAD